MSDQKLLQYYLNMREPEAYQWNVSPRSLYLELETRDFLLRNFERFAPMKACNIGIGVGEWDDYIGYYLKGYGHLTSIDIDQEICEVFEYRQQREGHTNPSTVKCCDFLECELPAAAYDLVTMIGSAGFEIGAYRKTFEKIKKILKPNGQLLYMDFHKYSNLEDILSIVHDVGMELEQQEQYDRYPSIHFYCMKIRNAK